MKINDITVEKFIHSVTEARMGMKDLQSVDPSGFTFGMEFEIKFDLDGFIETEFSKNEEVYIEDYLAANEIEDTEENKEEYRSAALEDFATTHLNIERNAGENFYDDPHFYSIEEYLARKSYANSIVETYSYHSGYDSLNSMYVRNSRGENKNRKLTPVYGFVDEENDKDLIYGNEEKTITVNLEDTPESYNEVMKIFDLFEESSELSDAFDEYVRENYDNNQISYQFTDTLVYLRNKFSNLVRQGWMIVYDGSLGEDGAEFVSPVYNNMNDFLSDMRFLFEDFKKMEEDGYLQTNHQTGFHVNIGRKEWKNNKKPFDIFKFLLLTNERYVLEFFQRHNSKYASNKLANTVITARNNLKVGASENVGQQYIENFIKTVNNYLWSDKKRNFADLSKLRAGDGYIELRAAGNTGYLKQLDTMEKIIRRYIRALSIASDPEMYKREYYKKVYSIVSSDVKDIYYSPKEEQPPETLLDRLDTSTVELTKKFFNNYDMGNPSSDYDHVRNHRFLSYLENYINYNRRSIRTRHLTYRNEYECIVAQMLMITQIAVNSTVNKDMPMLDIPLLKKIFKNINMINPRVSFINPKNTIPNLVEMYDIRIYDIIGANRIMIYTDYGRDLQKIFNDFTAITGITLYRNGLQL